MPCSGKLKRVRGCDRLPGVDLVLGTQAGQSSARCLERGRKRSRIGKAFGLDNLDAAGLEKTPGERRARGELGRRAEVGEKYPRPRPFVFHNPVRPVAQGFEGLGEPHWGQGAELYFRFAVRRKRYRLGLEYGYPNFIQVRKFRRAGQHFLARRNVPLALQSRRRDLVLDEVLFEGGECAARVFNLLE